jgi:hypothetical protein
VLTALLELPSTDDLLALDRNKKIESSRSRASRMAKVSVELEGARERLLEVK